MTNAKASLIAGSIGIILIGILAGVLLFNNSGGSNTKTAAKVKACLTRDPNVSVTPVKDPLADALEIRPYQVDVNGIRPAQFLFFVAKDTNEAQFKRGELVVAVTVAVQGNPGDVKIVARNTGVKNNVTYWGQTVSTSPAELGPILACF